MFSANFKYPLQSEEKIAEALSLLNEKVKPEGGKYDFNFSSENTTLLIKITATSSENLRIAINLVFPIIEQVIPFVGGDDTGKDDEDIIE
ncbi:hypothetical protein TVAG_372750 [Trichomonas vaginalis G3]|uniref:Uncharacterized protein n=1 Tax=Trichomonas vaginalis (strain ATCC PRA-98 / G3) TaxID=412133 RepID=A2EZ17_TRIV3|nr:hypothetical protein TVAGG3_0372940 [Trichomonas vaginalis G3]EAY02129.1 hypothetical protein TVAG_372750 [Trichomonas vaginalis G3]KAI5532726.1 hypothetical protein TVAGG3_0372940 [Trichomonas vaginalis G3]|eukprot:XP_001330549.1 hypothetical protein [Trichomonas vaginalis G3]